MGAKTRVISQLQGKDKKRGLLAPDYSTAV
jgi:hypothetical protein